MSVKIRLRRMGAKKRPFYRLVVADARSPRDGRFIEAVGTYDPLQNPALVKIDGDRVKDWLSKGARPTDLARQLLINEGLLERTGPVYEKKSDGTKLSKKAQAKAAEAAAAAAAAKDEPAKAETPEEAPARAEAAEEEPAKAEAAVEAAAEPEAAEPAPAEDPEKSVAADVDASSPASEAEPEPAPEPGQHAEKPAEGASA